MKKKASSDLTDGCCGDLESEYSADANKIDRSDGWPAGEAYEKGAAYYSPIWIGVRHGNQVARLGYSHSAVQNLTQNFVHKYLAPTPMFIDYNSFVYGPYMQISTHNPFSLW